MSSPQNYQTISRRPPDIEDYIDMLRRYRSWIIGPMFAGLVIAVVVAFLWPDTYVSYAVMHVIPPQVPAELIPAVTYSQMSERLQQMQTEILSRTTLEEIIRKPSLDLYKKQRERVPMEDIIQDMKNKYIGLSAFATNDRRMATAFQISFKYPDKYKAQLVVRELVTRFMEQNIRFQGDQAKLTTRFLEDEVRTAKERMDSLDQQLTRFKIANNGRLPDQMQANTQAMIQLQVQAMNLTQQIDRDSQEKTMLESDLQNLKTTQQYYASNLETIIPGSQASVKSEKLIDLNKQITTGRGNLASMEKIYGPKYPEIGQLKAVIESLEKQRDELLAEESAQAPTTTPARKVVNPTIEKGLQELRNQQNTIQAKIAAKDAEIQTFTRQKADLEKEVDAYRKRISEAPMADQQYAALVSDFNLAKQAYADAVKKREAGQTAENLEQHKAGETLEVLDAATLPDKPIEPNRWAWAGFGTLAGLVLGLGLAAAKEVKNTSLKNLKDVRAYTNLPVLSSIPLLENALLLRRKRRLVWLAWSSAIIIGCVLMLGSMYYYFSSTV